MVGTIPESTLIVDLSTAVSSDIPDSSCPEQLTFFLSDESIALGLNEILELSKEGHLKLLADKVTEKWIGSHLVTFVAFDSTLDPGGLKKKIAVDLSVLITISAPKLNPEDAITAFTKDSPIIIGENLPAIYMIA